MGWCWELSFRVHKGQGQWLLNQDILWNEETEILWGIGQVSFLISWS